MSATLHVLLEAEPRLTGDVADLKTDPTLCHQLGEASGLHYLVGMASSMDHQLMFGQVVLYSKILDTGVALGRRAGQGAE